MWGGMTDHDHLSIADTDPAELAEQREADAKAGGVHLSHIEVRHG